jgi:hypothetical protein
MTRIELGLYIFRDEVPRRKKTKQNTTQRTRRLTIWLLPIDGSTSVGGRGREYDLAPYAVPLWWRRRGVVDGPQYRVDE